MIAFCKIQRADCKPIRTFPETSFRHCCRGHHGFRVAALPACRLRWRTRPFEDETMPLVLSLVILLGLGLLTLALMVAFVIACEHI
jgi:hypothetical protein